MELKDTSDTKAMRLMLSGEILFLNAKKLRKIEISSFLREPALKTLSEFEDKQMFVLCVGYKEGDYQIGASETPKKGEDLLDTARRCLEEEFGFRCELTRSGLSRTSQEKKIKRRSTKITTVNLSRLSPRGLKVETSKGKDDKSRKSLVLPIGSIADAEKCLRSIDWSTVDETDDIAFFIAVRIDFLLDFFEK